MDIVRYLIIGQGNRGPGPGKLLLAAMRRRTERMKTGELRQYHYFLVLAQELHFGRAAEKCHVTQSALSQQISRLEELLEVKLFVRDPRQVTLTPAGVVFRQGVTSLFADIDSLTRRTRAEAGIEDLRLSLGLIEYANIQLVPASLMRLRAQYPQLALTRHEIDSGRLAEALLRGRIDIGLGVALWQPPADSGGDADADAGPDIDSELLATSPWRLLMRADYAQARGYAADRPLDLASLARVPVITFARDVNPPVYDGLMRACQTAGVRLDIVYHTSQAQAGIELAREGMGAMLGSGLVLGDAPPGMLTVQVTGFAQLAVRLYWRADEKRKLVRDFIGMLRAQAA